jgi:hypothetical protein
MEIATLGIEAAGSAGTITTEIAATEIKAIAMAMIAG